LPPHIDEIRLAIWKAGKTSACVDIIAWRGERLLFIEAKRSKRDRPTKAQLKFIEAALSLGFTSDNFLFVEWGFS
jgi:Holliday junction resolvase